MNDDLADRLDAAEEDLLDTSSMGTGIVFEDPDLNDPDTDRSDAIFYIPREVTDNWDLDKLPDGWNE